MRPTHATRAAHRAEEAERLANLAAKRYLRHAGKGDLDNVRRLAEASRRMTKIARDLDRRAARAAKANRFTD